MIIFLGQTTSSSIRYYVVQQQDSQKTGLNFKRQQLLSWANDVSALLLVFALPGFKTEITHMGFMQKLGFNPNRRILLWICSTKYMWLLHKNQSLNLKSLFIFLEKTFSASSSIFFLQVVMFQMFCLVTHFAPQVSLSHNNYILVLLKMLPKRKQKSMLPSLPHLLQVVQVVFHRYFLGSRHSTQVSLSHNNNIKPGIVTSCRHALICMKGKNINVLQ